MESLSEKFDKRMTLRSNQLRSEKIMNRFSSAHDSPRRTARRFVGSAASVPARSSSGYPAVAGHPSHAPLGFAHIIPRPPSKPPRQSHSSRRSRSSRQQLPAPPSPTITVTVSRPSSAVSRTSAASVEELTVHRNLRASSAGHGRHRKSKKKHRQPSTSKVPPISFSNTMPLPQRGADAVDRRAFTARAWREQKNNIPQYDLPPASARTSLNLPKRRASSSLAALTSRENSRMERMLALITSDPRDAEERALEKSRAKVLRWQEKHEQEETNAHINLLMKQIKSTIVDRDDLDKYEGHDVHELTPYREFVDEGQYAFFRLFVKASSSPKTIRISLEVLQGRLDLFISTTKKYCYDTDHKPQDYQWSYVVSGNRTIEITPKDTHYDHGCYYYLSFRGYAVTTFRFQIHTHEKKKLQGHQFKTAGLPSRKRLQQELAAQIEFLKKNEHALAEFRTKVSKIHQRRMARPSTQPSRPVHHIRRNIQSLPRFSREKQLEHRQAWAEQHRKRAEEAKRRFDELQEKEVERVNQLLSARDDRRLQMRQHRLSVKPFQRLWISWMHTVTPVLKIRQALQYHKKNQERLLKLETAALTVQRWVRCRMQIKRRKRAVDRVQSLRTMVRLCAFNVHIIKAHRAADLIKMFLQHHTGRSKARSRTVSIIEKFRDRIVYLQRLIRERYKIRNARLVAWDLQWVKTEQYMLESGQLDQPIPPPVRRQVLGKHMQQEMWKKRQEIPMWLKAMKEYRLQVEMDKIHSMLISPDAQEQEEEMTPAKPRRPHASTMLPQAELRRMVLNAVGKARSFRRKERLTLHGDRMSMKDFILDTKQRRLRAMHRSSRQLDVFTSQPRRSTMRVAVSSSSQSPGMSRRSVRQVPRKRSTLRT